MFKSKITKMIILFEKLRFLSLCELLIVIKITIANFFKKSIQIV